MSPVCDTQGRQMFTRMRPTEDVTLPTTLPALTESKVARFVAIILLYFMQGVPIGLSLIAIPPWLAANGASVIEVGAFAATVILPWSMKVFGGLVMDRFTFRPMGRRRLWILLAQFSMTAILIGLAINAPSAEQIGVWIAFCFALNLCAMFNDVATDGMTIDLVPDEERTTINGLMFAAQWLGIAIVGLLAAQFLAAGQVGVLGVSLAAMVAVISTGIALFRERPKERLMPWSQGRASAECEARQQTAWTPIFKGLMRGVLVPTTLFFFLGVACGQASNGFVDAVAPTLGVQKLGMTSESYSQIASLVGFFCGVGGALLAPVLIKVLGLRVALYAYLFGLALTTIYAGLAVDTWQTPSVFIAVTSVQQFLITSIMVATVVWAMRICNPAIAASLFAVFMAVPNLSRSMMSSGSGWVVESVGYSGAYFTVAAFAVISILFHTLAKVGNEALAA